MGKGWGSGGKDGPLLLRLFKRGSGIRVQLPQGRCREAGVPWPLVVWALLLPLARLSSTGGQQLVTLWDINALRLCLLQPEGQARDIFLYFRGGCGSPEPSVRPLFAAGKMLRYHLVQRLQNSAPDIQVRRACSTQWGLERLAYLVSDAAMLGNACQGTVRGQAYPSFQAYNSRCLRRHHD
jgi:hypothetical protein